MFSESAAFDVFLHRYDKIVLLRQIRYHLLVDRFDKSGIYKGNMFVVLILQYIPYTLGCLDHAAYGQKCYARFFIYHLALSEYDGLSVFLKAIVSQSSRIPYGNGFFVFDRKLEHVGQLPFVLRCHDSHVRYARQIRQVKYALMRLTVRSYYPRSVYRKDNRQILYADIVDYLIISSLQK